MSNNKTRLYLTAICLIGGLYANAAKMPSVKVLPRMTTEVPDTLWDESGEEDTIGKTRKNYATEFNALKYVLEKRYRGYDDQFRKKWYDHLFMEFGGGIHKDLGNIGWNVSPLTTAHVSLGKQFNRLHSARLTAGLGYGYYEANKRNFAQMQLSADWLFSLSSFMDGYCPSRLLDVSSVVGFGYRKNLAHDINGVSHKYEAHIGLQARLFTGPQGYVAIEPYAGVTSPHLYNKYGCFYGVNVGVVYYLNNNLSIEDRMRYMKNRPEAVDSVLNLRPGQWRTPWFAQVSGGLGIFKGGSEKTRSKLGHSTTVAIGRWFSPVVGARISGSLTNITWDKQNEPMGEQDETRRDMYNIPVQDDAVKDLHNMNFDLGVEALINPLGFLKNYSFDQPFNMAVALGGGVGWLIKNQRQPLRTVSTFYSLGLNFSYNLSNDLQVFIEPHYANYNYRIPYSNIDRNKRYNDDVFSVRLGFTAYTRGTHYRARKADYEPSRLPLSFGAGIGTSLMQTQTGYEGAGFNYNAHAFAEYHITKEHGVRVSFEYMNINSVSPMSYTATNEWGIDYRTTGLFSHNYKRGFLSLDYLVNITNLCSGYEGQRTFEAEAFCGPMIMFALGNSHKPDASIKMDSQYRMSYSQYNYTKPLMGANGGIKIKMNVMKHLAVTLTPQVYVVRYSPQLQGVDLLKVRTIQTLDLGVQYNL